MVQANDPYFPTKKMQKIQASPPNNQTETAWAGATMLQTYTINCAAAIVSNGNYSSAKNIDNSDPAKVLTSLQWIAATAKAQAIAIIAELNKP